MAARKLVREAIAEDLRRLADDLMALLEDPKKRARKEQQWRLLYGAVTLGFTVLSQRLATRAWEILTGERPPTKTAPRPKPRR
jgi:hypothetical protein